MPVDDRDLDGAHTTAETADLMHVSVPTVKRMLRDGELEHFRIRGRVFIPHRAVLVYINSTHTPAVRPEVPPPVPLRRKPRSTKRGGAGG